MIVDSYVRLGLPTSVQYFWERFNVSHYYLYQFGNDEAFSTKRFAYDIWNH